MLAVSAHVTVTQHSRAPASRRRIRVCNGWIMLLTIPLIAAGVSLVSAPQSPRLFTLTWAAVVLLLVLSIALAAADALNTIRIARNDRRRDLIELAKRNAAERARRTPDVTDHDRRARESNAP